MTDATANPTRGACTCFLARRLARGLTRLYDRELAGHGITVGQFSVLRTVSRSAKPLGLLAEELGLDRTTLNRNLKPLMAAGLVANLADPGDARTRRVATTAEGLATLRAAREDWRRVQIELEELLGTPTLVALHELLESVHARIEGLHSAPLTR